MARYIDADALLKYKAQLYDENGVGFYAVGTGNILRMPTADVVEVVRCKDCIHHQPFPFSDEHICDVFDWKSEDKDFCSFAERRTE